MPVTLRDIADKVGGCMMMVSRYGDTARFATGLEPALNT